MRTYNLNNITYKTPEVYLLNHSGFGVSEFASRTAYDSFKFSENQEIKDLKNNLTNINIENLKNIKSSKLLHQLAWVHFHHSVLEHISLSYYIKDISRGVLQELSRHRIASFTVKSTRYTMTDIIYIFIISKTKETFRKLIKNLDLFIITDISFINIEIDSMYNKLLFISNNKNNEFISKVLGKDNYNLFSKNKDYNEILLLEKMKENKSKRNVGDFIKTIVTDNWKTELVFTINLRSLKNFFNLRYSNSAYFQIHELAKEIKNITPEKYLKLIIKN